jgi:hypothetical protein
MLAAMGRLRLSILWEWVIMTLVPTFKKESGRPVAALPNIRE